MQLGRVAVCIFADLERGIEENGGDEPGEERRNQTTIILLGIFIFTDDSILGCTIVLTNETNMTNEIFTLSQWNRRASESIFYRVCDPELDY